MVVIGDPFTVRRYRAALAGPSPALALVQLARRDIEGPLPLRAGLDALERLRQEARAAGRAGEEHVLLEAMDTLEVTV